MDNNLQINEFNKLINVMHKLCDKVPEAIFLKYFDTNKHLYSLYFDAFISIKGFCMLIADRGMISQACMILRMAIEKTAIIKVLEAHKELLPDYIEHSNFRLSIRNENNKPELIKEKFKDLFNPKKENPLNFLEYGWFKSLDQEYSLDSLIKLSKIQEDDAINKWKNELNQWTHGTINYISLYHNINSALKYEHNLILIAAELLDNLICEFHKENKFDFIIDNIDYRKDFLNSFKILKWN